MKEKDNVRAFLPKYAKGAVSKRVMASESEKRLAGLESLQLGVISVTENPQTHSISVVQLEV
jgi:hypothetical protein